MASSRSCAHRILNVTSHATLMGLEGPLPDWQAARDKAQAMPGVIAAVPYIEAQAMLAAGERLSGHAAARHRSRGGGACRRHRQDAGRGLDGGTCSRVPGRSSSVMRIARGTGRGGRRHGRGDCAGRFGHARPAWCPACATSRWPASSIPACTNTTAGSRCCNVQDAARLYRAGIGDDRRASGAGGSAAGAAAGARSSLWISAVAITSATGRATMRTSSAPSRRPSRCCS